MDWMKAATDSLVEKIQHKINDLGYSLDQAVAAVKMESTAGNKAWESALAIIDRN